MKGRMLRERIVSVRALTSSLDGKELLRMIYNRRELTYTLPSHRYLLMNLMAERL